MTEFYILQSLFNESEPDYLLHHTGRQDADNYAKFYLKKKTSFEIIFPCTRNKF